MKHNISGIINIYKEKGYTSHDVVAIVKKMIGKKNKVGHTGTLDPDAEGVLPICIGKATKLSDRIMSDNKEYVAKLRLGITTDTLDITGKILETKDVNLTYDEKISAINSFAGEYEQTPPMYSALKVNGKKLYELARDGVEIERKKRKVSIYGIDILSIDENEIAIKVRCSKGTYIRSLCADIGDKLGVGATMTSLIRTETGSFNIENSIKIEYLKKLYEFNRLDTVLLSLESILKDYQKMIAVEEANHYLYNGNKISKNYLKKYNEYTEDINFEEEIVLLDYNHKVIGIYKLNDDNMLVPQIFLFDKNGEDNENN